jgi:hypothetical protein
MVKGSVDPLSAETLARQAALQRRLGWDLEADIPWHLGVDTGKYLLPLDDCNIAFPGASAEQRLALSQYMGLVVNATISEMEDALPRLKFAGWERLLRGYPVNPEMRDLGELFFDEEAKHARAFRKYLGAFSASHGLELDDVDRLLPKAFGSFFQQAITANAVAGGHAFWWVVASVEEVSVSIYQHIFKNRKTIDPLFFQLHKRHLEEEARHANYAFLMLDLAGKQPASFKKLLHRKVDFLVAQIAGGPWVVSELAKFFEVKKLKHKHPLFDVLASCVPLFESMSKPELVRRLFFAAPYVSWLMNPAWREDHRTLARALGAIVPPMPAPAEGPLSTNREDAPVVPEVLDVG